ncbi:MAG: hypothetical protein DRO12_05970 [Thermoprotei archaeon]|nr:MAG: hypothetical protein DRO12_05970 [Thermoprotei archaeon]
MKYEDLKREGLAYFNLLLHEDREKIVRLLRNNKMTTRQLAKTLKLHPSVVTYHLHILRLSGILGMATEKIAPKRIRLVFYVNEEKLRKALETIKEFLEAFLRRWEIEGG